MHGNFTEAAASSSPPVLDFPVAAAANSNAAPKLTVTGSTTLAGNLTAEFSNGFAAVSGSAYIVADFSSSATGAVASTAGVKPDFTVAVNPTSIVLNSSAAGAADLTVTSVSAPAKFTPGETGAITWNVTNKSATATGDWTDSVYLSADGTVNAGDLLLGRVTHTGGLGSGASYTGSLTATFPAAAGTYEVVVVIDSTLAVPETNRAGTFGISSPIASSLPALTLGGSVTGTLSAGEDLLYTLVIPGGTDVRVERRAGRAALTGLEISRGAVPAPAMPGSAFPSVQHPTPWRRPSRSRSQAPTTFCSKGRARRAKGRRSLSVRPRSRSAVWRLSINRGNRSGQPGHQWRRLRRRLEHRADRRQLYRGRSKRHGK